MYINSNHLRVVKLLQGIADPNIQFISKLLGIGESNVIQYIKTVYSFIEPNSTSFRKQEMIEVIRSDKSLVERLRKFQEITKEERQVYIIFSLFQKREINLIEFADLFSITRRSLNNDILEIKEMLSSRQLEILSDNFKGIRLIGKDDTIMKIFNNFIYKIRIELEELPELFQKIYKDYFKEKNYEFLREEAEKFISEMGLNRYFNAQDIYATFALTFIDLEKDTFRIKDLSSYEEFYTFCKDSFSEEYSKKLFYSLKNSYLGNFSIYDIRNLILFIKTSNGDLYISNHDLLEKTDEIRPHIEEILNINLKGVEYYVFHMTRMLFFSQSSFDLKIKDFTFLSLNVEGTLSDELITLYLYLKNHVHNVGFSLVLNMYMYLSYLRENAGFPNQKTYLLYENIPENLVPIIINKIKKQYGLKIIGSVNLNRVDNFIEEINPESFIILEKFTYDNPSINVKYLAFPI